MACSRRDFVRMTACGAAGGAALLLPRLDRLAVDASASSGRFDLVIAGGGLGGVAAALTAAGAGLRVALTEETDWIGGQLTQQGVPPDEHPWIETHGSTRSYRELRTGIRDYYRRYYPLTDEARGRADLNPGDGAVSRLCHEPRVALAVLEGLLAPHIATSRITLLLEHAAFAADVDGDRVRAVAFRNLRTGRQRVLEAPCFIDATELGDLLPLTGTEFVTGCEGRAATGEPHTPEKADPANQQAFTAVFVMDFDPGADHVVERPRDYAFWRDYVPRLAPPWTGRLLALASSHPVTLAPRQYGFDPVGDQPGDLFNLWRYRRIASRSNFRPDTYAGDLSTVNWPQNDYLPGNLVGLDDKDRLRHVDAAKQLSLSLLYWLQTEAPRPDGKAGWPGLRLRGDVLGTEDGLAKYPYVREARRIRAVTTVLEQHCGSDARAAALGSPAGSVAAFEYPDSVGIGSYRIDLHPSSAGDNYIDVASLPFQIPLGALLPVRIENLVPACKNIGTTHVTNGCYRLHPVEWTIGEAAGALVAFAHAQRVQPRAVRDTPALLADYQKRLIAQGVELRWPRLRARRG
ncbi:MAG: FAD-dependent oxidoreductase [Vicinamibacterales bacterium]